MALANFAKFKKFLVANIEYVIFSISTSITGFVLVLCSIYTFLLLFSGGFMTCVIPGDSNQEVLGPIGKFCFARSAIRLGDSKNEDYKEIVKHNIYIWTPYILLAQAILFYLPKYVLNYLEKNTFKLAMVSFVEIKTQSQEKRALLFARSFSDFMDRLLSRHYIALGPIICEIFNVVVITFQIYTMKVNLGTKFYEDTYSGNPFDVVFPKSTQCAYPRVERNGTIGNNVATCDMPINYANEVIYTYLWVWINLLLGVATLVILYRLISMLLYCRCHAFNRFEFKRVCPQPLKQDDLTMFTPWGFSKWLTLRRLAGELDGEHFELLVDLFERKAAAVASTNEL